MGFSEEGSKKQSSHEDAKGGKEEEFASIFNHSVNNINISFEQ